MILSLHRLNDVTTMTTVAIVSKFDEEVESKFDIKKTIIVSLPLTSSYSYPLHYVQFSFGSVNHKTEKQN